MKKIWIKKVDSRCWGYAILICYCVAYALALNKCLLPNLMNGQIVVVSYNKMFSVPRFILCVLETLFLYWITEKVTRQSDSIVNYTIRLLFLFYQVPVGMTLCIFNKEKIIEFWLLEFCYWIVICLIVRFVSKAKISNKTPKLLRSLSPKRAIRVLLFSILIVGLYLSIRRVGSFSLSISLNEVYVYRQFYKDNSSDLVTFFKSALGGFLCPCLIAYYTYKRKPIITTFCILLQIAFFSLARDKTYLFLLPIAFLLGLFAKVIVGNFRQLTSFICASLAGLSLLSLITQLQEFVFEILIRRIFVVPSFLNYIYFYFFQSNEPVWWRQDTFLVDKLFTPVYSESVPLVIANRMLDGKETNPNAGMFAEAFSRCGILGIIIYPLLLVVMLKLLDVCFKNTPAIVRVMLSLCLTMSISNDVITSTSFVCMYVLVIFGSVFFSNRKLFSNSTRARVLPSEMSNEKSINNCVLL